MSTNDSWGCNFGDDSWKRASEIIGSLATCVHNGGNFLLNCGPLADGSIQHKDRLLFEEIGGWVERNKEAVFGTLPNPFNYCDQKLSCYRGTISYTAFSFWHGPETVIAGVGNRVLRAWHLATGEEITFNQIGDRVMLTGLPKLRPDILPVIAMQLDEAPRGVENPYKCGTAKFVF